MREPYDRERARMVEDDLRRRGIRDSRVLEAMASVPRHRFVPAGERPHAYADRALPLRRRQTISQPYIVAFMTEALRVRPSHRVLEVGTGSGYQTAVLGGLVSEVNTIELIGDLQRTARELLEELGVRNVRYRVGNGALGWPEAAPFDRILVTAGAREVPDALKRQLSPDGGLMVIPVGDTDLQELTAVAREGTVWSSEPLLGCRFVPLVVGERC